MKKFVLFFIGCMSFLTASSQYNYYKLSAGVGAGMTVAYADLAKIVFKPAFSGFFEYNITPFTFVGLEVQKGNLSGGDKVADPHLRFFNNSYMSATVGGRAQLAQFVNFESSNLLYALRGFYVGTGVGFIKNDLVDIVRVKPDGSNYVFPGVSQSTNIVIPINTGISFNFIDKWRFTKLVFSANYQLNATFGEGIDGYNDPKTKFNNPMDFYGAATISLRYCFGPEGLH